MFELAFYMSFVDVSEPEIPEHDALFDADYLDRESEQFQPLHELNGVPEIIDWWSDGEDCRYETN